MMPASQREHQTSDIFKVYTDGGYNSKKRLGAAACILLNNGNVWAKRKHRGDFFEANGAELMAAFLAVCTLPIGAKAVIYSDSNFVRYAATLSRSPEAIVRWINRKPEKRLVYSAVLPALGAALDLRSVSWRWVRGDGFNVYNLWCDKCCREEMHHLYPKWWHALQEGSPARIILDQPIYAEHKDLIEKETAWMLKGAHSRADAGFVKTLELIDEWRAKADARAKERKQVLDPGVTRTLQAPLCPQTTQARGTIARATETLEARHDEKATEIGSSEYVGQASAFI